MAKVVQREDTDPPIKELTLTVRRTFNLGNFESLSLEATAMTTLESWRTVEAATDKVLPHIRKALQKAYDDYVDTKGRPLPL